MVAPDDWHLHLRDGQAMAHVVAATALHFGRAVVMPNLKPPVVSVEQALAYRARILDALKELACSAQFAQLEQARLRGFEPLMTLYLTAATSVETIHRAADSEFVHAVKFYPAGATTNSEAGVHDLLAQCPAVLEAMQERGLPLLVHGEVTNPVVDVFDREAVFIDTVLEPLRTQFPLLRVVMEHITTQQAAQYVSTQSRRDDQGRLLLAATVTPQHLLYNRNALFNGGLQPHWYCLPVLKREVHRLALLKAVSAGLPQFFLGTDSAPHARHLKEMACGCAGCYTAPYAMPMYAQAFDEAGLLETPQVFEAFCSLNGPAFYGLPVNTTRFVLERLECQVPDSLPFVDASSLVPFRAGQTLPWRVAHTG